MLDNGRASGTEGVNQIAETSIYLPCALSGLFY